MVHLTVDDGRRPAWYSHGISDYVSGGRRTPCYMIYLTVGGGRRT